MPSKKLAGVCGEEVSPYPDFESPRVDEVQLVREELCRLHGEPTRGETVMPVLDSLVRTVLSQNTTDKNSRAAFLNLKKMFPTWLQVYKAQGTGQVEAAIKVGGLSEIKAKNIHNILSYLLEHHPLRCSNGEPSYDWLRDLPTETIKEELIKHKGVGPKTISCVLMFNLNRAEFPVDTHVLHITKQRLGWAPSAATAESAYLHLNATIPDSLKYDIHVLLVEHGKRCPKCSKGSLQLPQEGPCPLGAPLRDKLHQRRMGKGQLEKRGREEHVSTAFANESKIPEDDEQGGHRFGDMCGHDCDDIYKSETKGKKKLKHLDMQG